MFAGERLLKNGRDFKLPFDVFSPLPPGQPKPDEWKKVNRSKHWGFSFLVRVKLINLQMCLLEMLQAFGEKTRRLSFPLAYVRMRRAATRIARTGSCFMNVTITTVAWDPTVVTEVLMN
jgi:hypothetical protein